VIAKTVGKDQTQQVYRALSREAAEKRQSPGHFAQELPRPQAPLRHVPSRHSGAIRDSSHLESQIDSGLQEHFYAYARLRGAHIADDIIEPDGRNWFQSSAGSFAVTWLDVTWFDMTYAMIANGRSSLSLKKAIHSAAPFSCR
jgi:hypothetical protein